MPYAELADVRLFYTDDGDVTSGLPLLLVHGWGADSHQWSWHLTELARRHRVIAPDLRGHGRSSVPAAGYTPQAMAADLAALLSELDTGPVVAVGHSMGAQVVSVLAVEHSAQVRAVVTVDAGYGLSGPAAEAMPGLAAALRGDTVTVAQAMERWCFTPCTPDVVRTWHLRQLAGAHPHVLAEAFAALFTDPDAFGLRAASERYLARRRSPVLSIWADPERAAWEGSLPQHPSSRVVTWPGAGHYLHEERPREFVRELEGWLAVLAGLAA